MKIEISGYELKIAIDEYLAKRGIDCDLEEGAYHEMSFSTTEYKREFKKHKNGKPVMQTINGHKLHVWHTTETKEVWHSFDEDNDFSIWMEV